MMLEVSTSVQILHSYISRPVDGPIPWFRVLLRRGERWKGCFFSKPGHLSPCPGLYGTCLRN